jgi:PST family polysaccharide transporter
VALAACGIRAILLGLMLGGLGLGYSLISRFFTGAENQASELRQMLGVLGWLPVVELVSGYPQVVMQRRLELGFIARVQMIQPVIFVGLAVALLVTGSGYMGVVWANLVSALFVALALWWHLLATSSARWSGVLSRGTWSGVMRGSGKVFLGGFGGYLGERVDNLLVAGTLGPAAMGFYSMAWNASRTPVNIFARAINFVLVPTISRIQDDSARVQRAIHECLRFSYLLLAPVCAVLFVSAPLLVSFVLGPKWLPLVPALRVMSITVLAAPLLFVSGALLVGTGRAHLAGVGTAAHIGLLALLVPILAKRWNITGAAFADMTATIVLTLVLLFVAHRATRQVNRSDVWAIVIPVLAGVPAAVLSWSTEVYVVNPLARLVLEIGMILTAYPLFLVLLGGRSRLFDLTSLVRGLFRGPIIAGEPNG